MHDEVVAATRSRSISGPSQLYLPILHPQDEPTIADDAVLASR